MEDPVLLIEPYISRLPPELILDIFKLLDFRSRLAILGTNRLLRDFFGSAGGDVWRVLDFRLWRKAIIKDRIVGFITQTLQQSARASVKEVYLDEFVRDFVVLECLKTCLEMFPNLELLSARGYQTAVHGRMLLNLETYFRSLAAHFKFLLESDLPIPIFRLPPLRRYNCAPTDVGAPLIPYPTYVGTVLTFLFDHNVELDVSFCPTGNCEDIRVRCILCDQFQSRCSPCEINRIGLEEHEDNEDNDDVDEDGIGVVPNCNTCLYRVLCRDCLRKNSDRVRRCGVCQIRSVVCWSCSFFECPECNRFVCADCLREKKISKKLRDCDECLELLWIRGVTK